MRKYKITKIVILLFMLIKILWRSNGYEKQKQKTKKKKLKKI